MKKRKAPYMTTEAFPVPEFTQVPNRFFDMLSEDMESSEVRVTLIMIRQTFGFHRDSFKMGLGKLADAAGISRNAAKDGAEAAEKRGTFRRTNPDDQGEAEWELAVGGQPVTPSTECIPPLQPVTTPPPLSDPQVGVKETLNKKGKKGDLVDGVLFFSDQAQEQKADKVEEVLKTLERGLRVNIARTTNNQAVAKRIIKDARPLERFLQWVHADEWRAAHTYLYAELERVWRDWPQAFPALVEEITGERKTSFYA